MATEIARYVFKDYEAREAAYNKLRYEFKYGYTTDKSGGEYYIVINDDIKDASLAGKICNASGGKLYDRGGGGCFITTATLASTGEQDDGITLTSFRNFRDNWLLKQTNGRENIQEYYEIAPAIVANIDKNENSKSIYHYIYTNYLTDCYKMIENKKFKYAFEKYKEMIVELKIKYM